MFDQAPAFLACGLMIFLLSPSPAISQDLQTSSQSPSSADSVPTALKPPGEIADLTTQRVKSEQELAGLKSNIELSEARKNELGNEIAQLETDRATLNKNLIDISTRSRTISDRIDRAAVRLEELRTNEARTQASLKQRKAVLVEVIAALQRMGRNPPPALLVTPEDALSSVRSAILLGAVVPEMRNETQILVIELKDLVRIRTEIDENRQKLSTDLKQLAEDEERIGLLLDERKKQSTLARSELARQTALSAELAGKAGNLESLIGQLENQIDTVKQVAEAAKKAEFERIEREKQQIASAREAVASPGFSDTARLSPAIAFADAKGRLPKPVSGVELARFDQKLASGEPSQGLSIATRASSRVSSPTDGWVIYAGPFRSYGQLLIINAGNGYHMLLAGMDRIDVELGQFVLAGEPVGIMGDRRIASTADVDIGSLRPILYVELRKDGKSIDPSPWWSTTQKESNG